MFLPGLLFAFLFLKNIPKSEINRPNEKLEFWKKNSNEFVQHRKKFDWSNNFSQKKNSSRQSFCDPSEITHTDEFSPSLSHFSLSLFYSLWVKSEAMFVYVRFLPEKKTLSYFKKTNYDPQILDDTTKKLANRKTWSNQHFWSFPTTEVLERSRTFCPSFR